MRLIAEENAILTDGTTETPAVDVMLDEVDKWQEITEEEAERLQNIETPTEEEAGLKSQAYDILMGVTE
jgi:uncharacterized protein YdaT